MGRWTTAAGLALAALLLAAGAFTAGWVVHGETDDGPIGGCTVLRDPYGVGCSSNEAVLAYEQKHSLVCYRKEEYGLAGRGLYGCVKDE